MQFDPELASAVGAMISSGRVVKRDSQKLGGPILALQHDTPWIFVGRAHQPHCGEWNKDYWQKFRLIPRFCRERCHKVVVKIRTVKELFSFWELMETLGEPGKLGLDKRAYTFGPYAAFFYTSGMEEGLQRYAQVRAVVDESLEDGKNLGVILKKGCTEMEHKLFKGIASDAWGSATEEHIVSEMMIDDMVERVEDLSEQPPWLQNYVAFHWLAHAHAIGDSTYYEVVEKFGCGDMFGDPPKTYHHLCEKHTAEIIPIKEGEREGEKEGKEEGAEERGKNKEIERGSNP